METKGDFKKASVLKLGALIAYSDGGIVSRQVIKGDGGNITLFSFAKGQELSEHTAPFDALVQILEGRAEITIAGNPLALGPGDSVIMPAGVPHALKARENFKMLLTMLRA